MAFSAAAIANQFLDAATAKTISLTPLQLQKLIYFAHGWHLALSGDPLIGEAIQAWKLGPVIYSVYREFKKFRDQPITERARDLRFGRGPQNPNTDVLESHEPSIDDAEESGNKKLAKAIVARVLEVYGQTDGLRLATLTHREGAPWSIVLKKFNGRIPPGLTIPNGLIEEWFRRELRIPHPEQNTTSI